MLTPTAAATHAPLRLLIVDDERPARDKLRRLLEIAQRDGAVAIGAIAEARDGVEALAVAAAFEPDAIFLDIEMPELSGFDVAAALPLPAPLIVFVTAYNAYAIRAFDANAIDYLLKPYDDERLQRALVRLAERCRERATARSSAQRQEQRPAAPEPLAQLLVSERGVTRVLKTAELDWLETADNYVVLHTQAGAPLLRHTLAGLLASLGPDFLRCHRRAAVRIAAIASVHADDKGDGELQLRSGARVPLSRQYRRAVLAALAAR